MTTAQPNANAIAGEVNMRVEKRGMQIPLTWEQLIVESREKQRRYHWEPHEPTAQEVAEHARALELKRELEDNAYLDIDGYDWEIVVRDVPTRVLVWDETHTEWMKRVYG